MTVQFYEQIKTYNDQKKKAYYVVPYETQVNREFIGDEVRDSISLQENRFPLKSVKKKTATLHLSVSLYCSLQGSLRFDKELLFLEKKMVGA